MQVTAEQTAPCTIVLDIAVDEQQVAKAFDNVYREFSRYTNVPGFRPGKAPRAIVERYVNPEKVRERALEKLITDTYPKAIEEQGITPFRNPDLDTTDLEDKKPYTYKATVPLDPEVTLGEYTGLSVEKPVYPVNDEMVEARLTQIREERARLERITDRGVQTGDVLIAESQEIVEGDEDPAPARRKLVQVGNNIPGFDDAILGMTIDEERTFELTYPDDYDEEDKRGKKVTFTVKVSSISGKCVPELTDEFAKEIADVDTVEELRTKLKEALEAEAVRLSDQIAEQRLIQEIVNRATVYFPAVLVREEVEDDLRQLAAELRNRQMSYEQYLAQTNQNPESHQTTLAQQGEARIRALLTLREIANLEGLQASDEDVDAEFDRLLSEGKITEDQYENYKPTQRRRFQVANALVQQRLHDFLFANNTITEVEQTTPPDPEALAEANAEAEEEE